jgi:hypothetical protein
VQLKLVSSSDADLQRVPLDRTAASLRQQPGGSAGERILTLDQIQATATPAPRRSAQQHDQQRRKQTQQAKSPHASHRPTQRICRHWVRDGSARASEVDGGSDEAGTIVALV